MFYDRIIILITLIYDKCNIDVYLIKITTHIIKKVEFRQWVKFMKVKNNLKKN